MPPTLSAQKPKSQGAKTLLAKKPAAAARPKCTKLADAIREPGEWPHNQATRGDDKEVSGRETSQKSRPPDGLVSERISGGKSAGRDREARRLRRT